MLCLIAAAPVFIFEICAQFLNTLGLGALVIIPFALLIVGAVIIGTIVGAVVLVRRDSYLSRVKLMSIVVLLAPVAMYLLTQRYRSLVSTLEFESLMVLAVFLVPLAILTISMSFAWRAGRGIGTLLLLACYLLAAYILYYCTSLFPRNYDDSTFLKSLNSANYTYYLPGSQSGLEKHLTFYGSQDYGKGVDISTDSSASFAGVTVHLVTISEKPRGTLDVMQACGQELKTSYLAEDHPEEYQCQKVADSANGPIYQVSYFDPRFIDNRVSEFVLVTDKTYIYATYLSFDDPRVYDEDDSVRVLKNMKQAKPEEFLNLLQGR